MTIAMRAIVKGPLKVIFEDYNKRFKMNFRKFIFPGGVIRSKSILII